MQPVQGLGGKVCRERDATSPIILPFHFFPHYSTSVLFKKNSSFMDQKATLLLKCADNLCDGLTSGVPLQVAYKMMQIFQHVLLTIPSVIQTVIVSSQILGFYPVL